MTAKQEHNYLQAYEAAQAGGMNGTDCHEFALDHATRLEIPSAKGLDFFSWSELLKAGRRLLVSDPLKEARKILTDALCSRSLRHDERCVMWVFTAHHGSFPPAHPIWKERPACNCWVGRMAEWLKNNPEV